MSNSSVIGSFLAISISLALGGEPDYQPDVKPILLAKCGKRHGGDAHEADVRFDQLVTDFSSRAASHT